MSFEDAQSEPIPGARHHAEQRGLIPAFTFVVWVACVAIGATGLLSQPTAPPVPPASQPAAEVVNVSFESPPDAPDVAAAAAAVEEATSSDAIATPSVPAVALPSPAIGFAVPVEGAARVGTAAAAMPVARRPAPGVRHLSRGSTGGDRLPVPSYPYDAELAGQTGTVVVRFTVGADGHVTNVRVVTPCRWPLLNEAAARAAQDTPQPRGVEHEDEYSPTFQ